MRELSPGKILSPALYPSATRVWKRSGYELLTKLDVMERLIGPAMRPPADHVIETSPPDLPRLAAIDRSAFEKFWRMGIAGLKEAYDATPTAAVFISRASNNTTGYALVGTHSGISFLQRVAVDPEFRGSGHGSQLVQACLNWAASNGGRTMVLNVRPENETARAMYERQGFKTTGTKLELLEYKR
jgi:ribosomal protein S18 acetylase RimI-like enzyme